MTDGQYQDEADVRNENEAENRIWRDLKLLEKKMLKAAKQAAKVDRRLQDIRSNLMNITEKMENTRLHSNRQPAEIQQSPQHRKQPSKSEVNQRQPSQLE